ncbi:MAG: hypothetical protein EP330_20735 [Deltaproteobacteria bacterium]|nr:MAG: hypothetical protein EP330_20735 [Deltaproteobacteria bacterium]
MSTTSLLLFLFACGGDDAPPPPVAISVETEAVEAGPADIDSVLEENKGLIETCFQNELRENPKLTGRIEFEWVIDNHRVQQTQVVSSTFPEDFDIEPLATCVMEGSKSWHFPAGTGSVRYPITFTPLS